MARKPVDVGLSTFFEEHPEYSYSRMLDKAPRMVNVPLPKGSPGSLRVARRSVSQEDRIKWVKERVDAAYSSWRERRIRSAPRTGLRYQEVPPMAEHLTNVQRAIADIFGKADVRPPVSSEDEPALRAVETIEEIKRKWRKSLDGMQRADNFEAGQQARQLLERDYVTDRLSLKARQHWQDAEPEPEEGYYFKSIPSPYMKGTEPPSGDLARRIAGLALESAESPREVVKLAGLLDTAQYDDVYERDLGSGRHQIDIDSADPDRRGRFIYDLNDDTLTNVTGL